jgi:hypothetical protein
LELEHLISRKVPWSAILFGVARTDIPSLRTFLEFLLQNDSGYDSDDIDYGAPPRMCYQIDGEVLAEEAPRLMPSDQSPRSYTTYLKEKEDRLWAP